MILVVAVGADSVSAVAIPHAANLFKLLQTRGLLPAAASATDPASLAAVVRDPKVRRAFLGELNSFGKAAGLSRRELLGAVVCTADVWDPDSGLVTATLKPKRKAIESRYAAELEVRLVRLRRSLARLILTPGSTLLRRLPTPRALAFESLATPPCPHPSASSPDDPSPTRYHDTPSLASHGEARLEERRWTCMRSVRKGRGSR
jgi:hypothetical protein